MGAASRQSHQSHQSDPRVLGRRSLEHDHRHLAALLRPGMSVLDIGCGTGAITAGIAKAVEPGGAVTGADRDAALLEIARREHPGITFVEQDILSLRLEESSFDVVNAARTLQWVSDPQAALRAMAQAAKPGGWIVALDYDHTSNTWNPEPPAVFLEFYRMFLSWRQSNGWENRMASRLPALFQAAGLIDVVTLDSNEISHRGDAAAGIWLHVAETIGPKIAASGFALDVPLVTSTYSSWLEGNLESQILSLQTVIGRRPS